MDAGLSGVKDRLLRNVFIISVGSIGSRFLVFLLVPLFSFYLSPLEMGFLDVMMVTVELAVPIVTLELKSGVHRWLVVADGETERKAILSTSLISFSCILAVAICLYAIGTSFFFMEYPILVCLYFVTACFNSFGSAFARGMRENKLYALSDLFRSIVSVVVSWILLAVFDFGVKGILIAYVLAGIASIGLVAYGLRSWRYVSVSGFSKTLLFEFLSYGLPIIPYAVSWWLMNSANRYVILYFLGQESNGIYALSSRFAMILFVVYGIFHTAWMESAFTEFNTKHRDRLYSDVFAKYFNLSTTTIIVLIPFCKIFILYFLAKEYADSWRYLPVLLVGVLFATFASFFSTGYTGAKKTSGLVYTVGLGAVVNIATCWFFVPIVELQGVSIGVALGFLVTLLLQIWGTRRFFKIQMDMKKVAWGMAGVVLSVCLAFVVENLYGLIVFATGSLVIFLYSNGSLVKTIWLKIRK